MRSADGLDYAALDSEGKGYLNYTSIDLFRGESGYVPVPPPYNEYGYCYGPVWRWIHAKADRFPRAGIFSRELRTFYKRIVSALTVSDPLDYGPCWERDERGQSHPCRYTQTRIHDTEKAFASRGWGTFSDAALYLAGWDAGFQFASGSSRTSLPNSSNPSKS